MNKFFKSPLLLAVCAMVTFGMSSCDNNDDNNGSSAELTENQKEMKAIAEQYVSNTVNSTYAKLAQGTSDLYDELKALRDKFVKDPSSVQQSEIDQVCETFKDARQYYEESEAFLFGAATDFGVDPHIDTWPLDRDGLATALSNKSQLAQLSSDDEDANIAYAAGKLGQELLGFHGIEFIIFRNGANRTVADLQKEETDDAFTSKNISVTGKEELYYATAVAGDLRDRCYQLEVSWNPNAPQAHIDRVDDLGIPRTMNAGSKTYGEDMLAAANPGSTYATWTEVMTTIVKAGCENISHEVAYVKIGNPLGNGEDPNPNYIESPYSQRSFIDFKDNLLSIENSLYGGRSESRDDSKSIMAYLKKNNAAQATALENSLKDAISALETCQNELKGGFVNNKTAPQVVTAQEKVKALDDQLNKTADWFSSQK